MKLPIIHRLRARLRGSRLRDIVVAYRFRGVTEQDVFLASYPKSGSTWLTFMLSELLWGEGEQQEITDSRFIPTVEKKRFGQRRLPSGGMILRTHERYRHCCKKAIYMARDGRDVAVSAYFHIKRVTGLEVDFSEFLDYYLKGRFIGAGLWHEHVHNWLDSPCFQDGHGLLVRYEDLKVDPESQLRRLAEFLQVETTPQDVARAAAVGSLESMRKVEGRTELIAHRENGPAIPFVRKGVVGDWQNHFSAQDVRQFDAVAREAMVRLGYEDAADAATCPDGDLTASSPAAATTNPMT